MSVTGKDHLSGMPKVFSISSNEVYEALKDHIRAILNGIQDVLEQTPPELYSDIVKNGVYLAGGGALIRGLDKRLQEKTNIKFQVAEDPLLAVARGTGVALKNINRFSFLMK
jgi:rod shape-determining protein MreB